MECNTNMIHAITICGVDYATQNERERLGVFLKFDSLKDGGRTPSILPNRMDASIPKSLTTNPPMSYLGCETQNFDQTYGKMELYP